MDTPGQSSGVLLFACAGGSNVGQISNDAAIALEKAGVGKLFCLAGIGGHVEGIVNTTKGAGCTIAIDGCDVDCVRKTMEAAGIEPTIHVVATELGIEKAKTYEYPDENVCRVVDAVLERTGGTAGAVASGCCCASEGDDQPASCCDA